MFPDSKRERSGFLHKLGRSVDWRGAHCLIDKERRWENVSAGLAFAVLC